MKSICLVLPYFGKFNPYFSLFLQSCRCNPTISYLIYTDCTDPYDWPSNVHRIETTFAEFREKFSSEFDFDIVLDKPYKLCDYKPAYGEVLADDLSGFDFWGHCDCDLIFGNCREFLTDEILSQNNKIFSRGHMTLYHNDPDTNSFYRLQTFLPFQRVYTESDIFAFDEWGGVSKAWEMEGLPFYDGLVMDDIAAGLEGFRLTKELTGRYSPYKAYQTDLSRRYKKMKHIMYSFRDGELLRLWVENGEKFSEPVLYAHFQKRSMSVCVPDNAERFLIAKDSFLPYEEELTVERIKKLTGSSFSLKNSGVKARRAVYDLMLKFKS